MNSKEEKTLQELIVSLETKMAAQSAELLLKNRELEIEKALEKVRVRATGMRNSDELAETSAILFQQLKELNIQAIRTGVGIFDDAYDAMELWLTSYTGSKVLMRVLDYFSLHVHPVFENIIPARKEGKPFSCTVLSGNDLRQYYHTMSTYLSQPGQQHYNDAEYFYSFFFSEGTINVVSAQSLSQEECLVMIRFANVFGLIYTRFLDLQQAEAQSREMKKQSSLDRVRGQIASMRSTTDLERITPLVWNELGILEVPFTRCGVFIINEKTETIQIYLSASDGHPLATLKVKFGINELIINVVNQWRKKTVYTRNWDKADFIAWTNMMLEQGQIKDSQTYQDGNVAPDSLDLHFIPFAQGMLYIGNVDPLSADELNIAASLAEAFSIAYARYEDFIHLDKAKQRVETVLAELKATQSQLIQSEKMASLGELTAGIAHEIQNPLNFVNNFSEVNAELVEELQQELKAGKIEDAISISNDIKENEQKINHHGKRADAIVKGMLQHSRSSSGLKEPTDINALADEYLRLAYHGLRAKDKSFNATMKTDFDDSIGNINIIPQDIGRVILNLLINAFYAVHEKQQQNIPGYEPTVTIKTTKNPLSGNQAERGLGTKFGWAEMRVSDNGGGIPQKIVEKIFQPFFTTKPTGQGTGLGLSLSYDIIKAHGGGLKVETKEGEGTEFIIQLPVV